jgi:DinB superfamily
MAPIARTPSGRPEAGEYAAYAQADIDFVKGDDIVRTLAAQVEETIAILAPIEDQLAGTMTYAPGKWNLKQVIGHLSDDERIFAYRALCVARNDTRPLAGFEEKDYVRFASFNDRSLVDLLDELRVVRAASIALFRSLSLEEWLRRGTVNGYSATVRGLAFHMAGHELHHMRIVREKYLAGVRAVHE